MSIARRLGTFLLGVGVLVGVTSGCAAAGRSPSPSPVQQQTTSMITPVQPATTNDTISRMVVGQVAYISPGAIWFDLSSDGWLHPNYPTLSGMTELHNLKVRRTAKGFEVWIQPQRYFEARKGPRYSNPAKEYIPVTVHW